MRSKGQISLNFSYHVNFKDFYTKLCVCSNKLKKESIFNRIFILLLASRTYASMCECKHCNFAIFGPTFMKFLPDCRAKELGIMFTIWEVFAHFLIRKGTEIRPKSRPRIPCRCFYKLSMSTDGWIQW